MMSLWQDIRYGLRMLMRNAGFTVVAVLTLALGIGASTAMFSVVNTFILNPVPLAGGNRLVEINEIDQAHNRMLRVSPQVYRNLESRPEIFEKTASFIYEVIDVPGDEFSEPVLGCEVTPSFFEIIGIQPALGRLFHKEEGVQGCPYQKFRTCLTPMTYVESPNHCCELILWKYSGEINVENPCQGHLWTIQTHIQE